MRAVIIAQAHIKPQGRPVIRIIGRELPEQFGLDKVKIKIGTFGLSGLADKPPHEITIYRLLIMQTLRKAVIIKIIGGAILRRPMTFIDIWREYPARILRGRRYS